MQQLARLIVLLAVLSVLWNVPYTMMAITRPPRFVVPRKEEAIKQRLRLKKFRLMQDSSLLGQMP